MKSFRAFVTEEQLSFPYKTTKKTLSLSTSRAAWRKKAREWDKRMQKSRETLIKGKSH